MAGASAGAKEDAAAAAEASTSALADCVWSSAQYAALEILDTLGRTAV